MNAFRDSLAIAARLAKADPGKAGWQRDVAVSHAKIGNAQRALGDTTAARQSIAAGKAIITRLVADYPEWAKWKTDLAWLDAQLAALDAK